MTSKILTATGDDRTLLKTFKAGVDIAMGLPVKLSAAGTIVIGTADNSIGWAAFDERKEALNDAETWLTGDMVRVKLKGEIMNVTANAAIAVGAFTLGAAAGKYAPEAVVTTKTLQTEGIAITAAAADGSIFQMMRL